MTGVREDGRCYSKIGSKDVDGERVSRNWYDWRNDKELALSI